MLNADRLDGLDASAFALNSDVPAVEVVPASGTSTTQPPDPLPDSLFPFPALDVGFTTTVVSPVVFGAALDVGGFELAFPTLAAGAALGLASVLVLTRFQRADGSSRAPHTG
jgi:hypothetical protein